MHEDRTDTPKNKGLKQKVYKRLSNSYLRNSGLYYLQRHAASVAHFVTVMERKMQRSLKSHPEQDLVPFSTFLREELVPEFVRLGYLNDALYANGLINSLTRKGLPKQEIKRRVKQKGVEADIIEESETLEAHDDLRAAIRLMQRKRLGGFATRPREPQKDLAALARYGFSYNIAKSAIDTPLNDAIELLENTSNFNPT